MGQGGHSGGTLVEVVVVVVMVMPEHRSWLAGSDLTGEEIGLHVHVPKLCVFACVCVQYCLFAYLGQPTWIYGLDRDLATLQRDHATGPRSVAKQ